jgi:hypothetical protein
MSAIRAVIAWSCTGVSCITVHRATRSTEDRWQKSYWGGALQGGYVCTGTRGAHPSQGKGRLQIVVGLKSELPFEIVLGEPRGSGVTRQKYPSEGAAIGDHRACAFSGYCCKSRKSNNPKNLAKVDLWTSLLLPCFSTPTTEVRDRFWMKRCGPSRRLAQKRINGSKNFRSPPQKDFCNNIGAKRTSGRHRVRR